MTPEELIEKYEKIRGSLRLLPNHELLTLVGRLSTEYAVRVDETSRTAIELKESVNAGLRIAETILDARRSLRTIH